MLLHIGEGVLLSCVVAFQNIVLLHELGREGVVEALCVPVGKTNCYIEFVWRKVHLLQQV